ncbi:hypothetical protein DAPPUDRAFT_333553 [Daphnia pulex]|uniref:Uncharacterized protein n=1 Tax=Daphnia pulex TaxID=6669 RepID=E9HT53_DAPPU|nr:hypothetical protein DAPPUDRAFT_333553 [Daphnia pulex]|eukprot:EFX65075.1 hypothetical protein DAPPUDRAFT_333553 [Daphnia pulex]
MADVSDDLNLIIPFFQEEGELACAQQLKIFPPSSVPQTKSSGERDHVSIPSFGLKKGLCTSHASDFYQQIKPEHHKMRSVLEDLQIDMIKDIPLDYMHLVCMDVM